MLAGLCAVSLGASVATANASADEATTVTASTYAISEVFAGSGTAGEEEGSVAFTLGNDQDMRMKRDLAFKWYEAKGEAKYLTIKFAFKELNFTSLRYNRLDDMLEAVGIDKSKLCTYCWNGKE